MNPQSFQRTSLPALLLWGMMGLWGLGLWGCETPPCGVGGGLYGECIPPSEQTSDAAPSDGDVPEAPDAPDVGCVCSQASERWPQNGAFWLLFIPGAVLWRRRRKKGGN
jgi:hypothetical protein